jgi:hypothetical protein
VSTITLVLERSAATISTVNVPASVFTFCLEYPELGGAVDEGMLGALVGLGGTLVGVGVADGLGVGVAVGSGVAVGEDTIYIVGVTEASLTIWEVLGPRAKSTSTKSPPRTSIGIRAIIPLVLVGSICNCYISEIILIQTEEGYHLYCIYGFAPNFYSFCH